MTPLDKARLAYHNDPVYRNMVDTMINLIISLDLSPSEIRQAAMFACYLVEERKPIYLSVDVATHETEIKGKDKSK